MSSSRRFSLGSTRKKTIRRGSYLLYKCCVKTVVACKVRKYREAGPTGAPVVLPLHGFPTSSRMFRNLIPMLADKYRVIAPDYPAFGHSAVPSRSVFTIRTATIAFSAQSNERPHSRDHRANWWRQGMMGGAKAHYDGIVAFSQTDFTEDSCDA
jgi:alpha/beta hydrolase fold